jgi:hypothetical protein
MNKSSQERQTYVTTPFAGPRYALGQSSFHGRDQKILSRANAWFDRLIQQGKAKGGQWLAPEGRVVSGDKGKTVTDGPFAESKEAIAGYVL